MKRGAMKRVFLAMLMLMIGIFGTACGSSQLHGESDDEEERVTPYLERSQIKSDWDLIQYYNGMTEDCVEFLSDCMGSKLDEIEDVFIDESDDEAADREFKDIDFLAYSSMSLVHWMTPLNGVKLAPFQEKSLKKIKAAHEKIRGCEVMVTCRKDENYTYYDVVFELPDKEGTWHPCKEVQCFNLKDCYWAAEKYVDGSLIGFYGYRWLGNDTYAFSSNYVRAIMTYDDKRHIVTGLDLSTATKALVLLEEYAGHSFNFDDPYEFGWEDKFDPFSPDWVLEGKDRGGIFRRFQFDGDGNKMIISGLTRTLKGTGTANAKFDTNYEVIINLEKDAE